MLHKRRCLHVSVNDKVKVIAGNGRGTISYVIEVDTKNNMVKLANFNYKTKFTKKTKDNPGSMTKIEGWIHASNVKKDESNSNVKKEESKNEN